MLVVDGVVVVLLHQLQEVRELHGDHAPRRQHPLHAADEVVDVGHVRQHVVADQGRPGGPRRRVLRGLDPEEADSARDAGGDRRLGDVPEGSMPITGTPRALKYCSR